MSDTRLVSAPWATEQDLPDGVEPPPPWTWPDLLAVASEVLFELSGKQWRGTGTSRVQIVGPDGENTRQVPGWVPAAVGGGPDGPAPLVGGRGAGANLVVVKLPSSPVTSLQVLIGGDPVDPAAWRCDTTGLLERVDGDGWPVDGSMTVEFTSGVAPPAGGRLACVALAVELAKVAPGSTATVTSRLANVITQVVREGVTVVGQVPINLREALTSGLTGLPEVDLWLTSVNPNRMRRRARVWSPGLGRTHTPLPGPPSAEPFTVQPMTLVAATPTSDDLARRLTRRRAAPEE